MKTMTKLKRYTCGALLAAAALTVTSPARAGDDYVAHEWGTFTSVQGGDGDLVRWEATIIGELPKFIYDWMHPGLNRQATPELFFGKGGLTCLQRMETPVIYFYSDKEMKADVTVRFPKGRITEWYPQADLIGPATIADTNATTKHIAKDSVIRWSNVQIVPAKSAKDIGGKLPTDAKQGTHYFAARDTESAYLKVNNFSKEKPADELERFLFYRGSGSFKTPLKVTVDDAGLLSVENTGSGKIGRMFVLSVHDGMAEWNALEPLKSGAKQIGRQLNPLAANRSLNAAELKKQLGGAMVAALTEEGLYPAEAKAMVETWSKAWFTEEGTRVLYLLPRKWTDETLPLDISPKPKQLTRVMVGRAEVITPTVQREIAMQLKRSQDDDAQVKADARKWIDNYYQKFGRFAQPAFQLGYKMRDQLKDQPENKPVASAYTP